MEVTEEQLAKQFAAMEDEALLEASLERLMLTPLAQRVLESEVHSRGLKLPEGRQAEEVAERDQPAERWLTLERFRDLSAGIVARSALEAAEIPCFLRDENTVRMDWQISNFIGGMRLQVREQDATEAAAVLGGLAPPDLPEDDADAMLKGERCPHCGSTEIHRAFRFGLFSVAMVLALSIPAPQGKRMWTCDTCGKRWPDTEN
jgi:hypothetical protein